MRCVQSVREETHPRFGDESYPALKLLVGLDRDVEAVLELVFEMHGGKERLEGKHERLGRLEEFRVVWSDEEDVKGGELAKDGRVLELRERASAHVR